MNIFGYGPLSFGKVVEGLLGKDISYEAAILPDYALGRSPSTGNYGAFPNKGTKIEGIVLQQLDSRDLRFLNIFFDSYYEIRHLDGLVNKRQETVKDTYSWVVPTRYREVIKPKDFIPHAFDLHFSEDFIKACKEYRRQVMHNGHRESFSYGAKMEGF